MFNGIKKPELDNEEDPFATLMFGDLVRTVGVDSIRSLLKLGREAVARGERGVVYTTEDGNSTIAVYDEAGGVHFRHAPFGVFQLPHIAVLNQLPGIESSIAAGQPYLET